jgi:hypothetical protein
MESSASLAKDGISSARAGFDDPNLRLMFEARKEPNASAANSAIVIIVEVSLHGSNRG